MKKMNKLVIFLIPIGIAVNFVGGQIAILLKLPLYLDAIGTIVVGALCGGVPGALVGLITNLLNAITSPTTLYYAVLNVAFGFVAGWFSKIGVFKSLWKTLLSALVFGFIGGVIGPCITILFLGGYGANATGLITGALVAAGWSVAPACFASEAFADLLDKVPTVIIVFIILKSMPNRFLTKLPLGHVYIGASGADKDDEEEETL